MAIDISHDFEKNGTFVQLSSKKNVCVRKCLNVAS